MLDHSKVLRSLLVATLLSVSTVTVALAAANPNSTGQPSQSCQQQPSGPPGLLSTTNGFARSRSMSMQAVPAPYHWRMAMPMRCPSTTSPASR